MHPIVYAVFLVLVVPVVIFLMGVRIAAVKAAVQAGAEAVARIGGKLVVAHVIGRPHGGVSSLFCPGNSKRCMEPPVTFDSASITI